MRVTLPFLGSLALLHRVSAQCQEVIPAQYAGTPFTNSLKTNHALSNITFFKIRDPSGQHICTSDASSDFSLLNYISLNSTGKRLQNNEIKRLVIVVSGAQADAWAYHKDMINALQAMKDSSITTDNVAILAPYFPNDNHAGTGFPYNSAGTTPNAKYPSPALVWYGSDWGGGANNQYPPRLKTVSAYDVLDQLIQYYANTAIFPNIKQIVVSGHSMGAQMLHRYAAVGKTRAQLGVTVPVSIYIGNPSSETRFTSDRPLSTGKCSSTFNDWREGLDKYSAYGAAHGGELTYNAELIAQGGDAVLANYRGKTVAHGRGILDRGDYSEGLCAPYTTGKDRHERFFKFLEKWPPLCPDPAADGCHTVDFVSTTHNNKEMFTSPAGWARLFRDNFNGDNSKAYDFGYPRHSEVDDPYPDPAQAGAPLTSTDTNTYAGGKTHRGCFTDVDNAQSVATLTVVGYSGNLNTRTYCANTCTQKGYTIAGLRDSTCYCGNSLGSQTVRVVTSSCYNKCPGDSSLCGTTNRLSILSSVDV
ncbi:hypothetical protein JX265_009028 [Neoarthrinium moseri]|uniref:WSC domain-containing protein n=1 Tax=Neoarthrinium moseri TaxID=1658444 RepID=A0A9P9WH79_9PEZI|nr:uncharacterized protein JN550_007898 [Neoarthrinium moseri]KAI1846669.1 hypothetical protein JX266_007242 [Neoarthrinium moseri]KAI1862982.1 hypothetical protein JX265_009028 [Neoarthrinium moseri]KAI1866209.1 hypothetical protein JN550_007898 [Neoarthrinium moseri]